MGNQRIRAIRDAAALLFLRQGYSKTQISHIAKAIGVSVGTIYHEFAGKREIMHFVLKSTIEPEYLEREFERPITDDLFHGLDEEILAAFEECAEKFSGHLRNEADGYSFEALISDAFDFLSQYAVGCLFIEKNQFDFKDLASSYRRYRRQFFNAMTQYISIFIDKGILRPLKSVELTTTLIIEMLSWWTMDMRYTSFETKDIPVALAKEICMDNIITAYKL